MKVRVVILNYNGEKLLQECLPSVVEAGRKAKHPTLITVIDNKSEDRSLEILRDRFADVEVYQAPENRVLCSYNEYLQKIEEPIVILLNNDIRVAPDFVDPLLGHFEKSSDIFMVTPRCLSFDGEHYEGGRSQSRIKYGLFWNSSSFEGHQAQIDQAGFTMAAGFGAFDRNKFLELGGYDDLYLPGRLEDTDICFRAWKRGWRCLYEPHSVVYHRGAASFNEKYGPQKTLILGHRNAFLFLWKNITDPLYLAEHFLLLIPRLLYALLTGKVEIVMGFFKALSLVPLVLRKRKKALSEKRVRGDRQIFELVK